jgi:hypothetical protein
MSELAKTARNAMREKAERLTAVKGDPREKVDSSTWSPPDMELAGVKTGARPLSKRQYKTGGKVKGADAKKRGDRAMRKSGGRAESADRSKRYLTPDNLINRDVRMANEDREGLKHVGGFKKGGRTHKLGGGQVDRDDPLTKILMQEEIERNMKGRGLPDRVPMPPVRPADKPVKYTGPMPTSNPNTGYKKGGKADGHKVKWIQDAIKHPGSLHKALHVPKGEKIPEKKLHAAEQKGGKLAKKAHLAETLKRMHHAKGGKAKMSEFDWKHSKEDAREDRILAKKHHMTPMQWEESALNKKHDKQQNMQGLRHGGEVHHADCACHKCMGGRAMKYEGGGVFSGNSTTKVPGAVPGGRTARAYGGRQPETEANAAFRQALGLKKGGRTAHKKGGKAGGKSHINVNVIQPPHPAMAPMGGGAPMPPMPPRPPMAPPQGGAPMGGQMDPAMLAMLAKGGAGAPMGGGMPPQGMPMARKTGGRAMAKTEHVIDHAAGGGLGRLEKIKAYGHKA